SLPSSFNAFPSVQRFDQVVVDTTGDNVIDFDTDVFDNTRGTVTLALSSMSTTTFPNDPGTPTVNSGTSSFFVNLRDNTGLDPGVTRTISHPTETDPVTGLPLQANIMTGGFVPFAFIRDMATVDLIMSLEQTGLPGGDLASQDIPVLDNNALIFVERAFVLDRMPFVGPIAPGTVPATAPVTAPLNVDSSLVDVLPASASLVSVPEPAALVIATGALLFLATLTRRKIF
ncbi:MAG: hypothetical protein MI725_07970, partial [Pirellulales bacterium]|nr:hypothetical protein [Pirellulales bacterium]